MCTFNKQMSQFACALAKARIAKKDAYILLAPDNLASQHKNSHNFHNFHIFKVVESETGFMIQGHSCCGYMTPNRSNKIDPEDILTQGTMMQLVANIGSIVCGKCVASLFSDDDVKAEEKIKEQKSMCGTSL